MDKRKIAGIVAAIATLAASFGIGGGLAVAAEPTPETITLTSQSGVDISGSYIDKNGDKKTHSFKAYKLVSYPDAGITVTNGKLTGISGSAVNADVEKAIAAALKAEGVKVPGGDNAAENALLRLPNTDQGKVAAVAAKLAADTSKLGTGTAPNADNSDATHVRFTGLEKGYYLIVDESDATTPVMLSSTVTVTEKGASTTYDMLNSNPIGSGEVKTGNGNEQTNPTKTMTGSDGNKVTAKVGGNADGTVTVGQKYNFKLTFKVPSDKTYAKFSAEDTPSGMTIDQKSIKVGVADAALADDSTDLKSVTLTNGTGTTATNSTSGLKVTVDANNKLTLVPDPDVDLTWGTISTPTQPGSPAYYKEAAKFIQDNQGKTVTVTYSATIKSADAKNEFGVNLTTLDNHNITPPPVIVATHSYKFDLHKISASDRDTDKKVSVDKDKTGLPGATFTIQDSTGKYLKYDAGNWTDGKDTDVQTTDEHGNIPLTNIGAGTYTITEKTAPEGYMLVGPTTFKVVITADTSNKANATMSIGEGSTGLVDQLDATTGKYVAPVPAVAADPSKGITASDEVKEVIPVVVVANMNSLTQLPQTGGAGIIAIALMLALLLIAGVGIGFGAKRIRDRRLASANN